MAGDFPVKIRNISKDKYHATPINRFVKSVQEAIIGGLPDDVNVLESVKEWRLVSEVELATLESPWGRLVSQGTTEWTIKRRSIPVGIHQVIFSASYKVGDPLFPQTLKAFDYGFIEVTVAPVRAIIDGGSRVRWGSTEIVNVDGSLSYDGDIGPGDHTGLNFNWTCFYSEQNVSMSTDCFGSFVEETSSITSISIFPGKLEVGKSYVLRLTVSKDERSSFTDMSFEIYDEETPQVILR